MRWLFRLVVWWAHGVTTASQCSVSPRHLCPDAFEAVRSHDLRWDGNDWVVMHLPRRRANWRARYLGIGADGDPYTFTHCPWCQGELPTPEGMADAA